MGGGWRYPTEDEGAEDTPLRIWGLKIPHTCPDTPEMGMLKSNGDALPICCNLEKINALLMASHSHKIIK